MAISGLVVHLNPDPQAQQCALGALRADPRIELGTAIGHRLPLVTETQTVRDARQLCEQLVSVRGIDFIDLVYVDFSDSPEEPTADHEPTSPNPPISQ